MLKKKRGGQKKRVQVQPNKTKSNLWQNVGRKLGGLVPLPFGKEIGGFLGQKAGPFLKRITGMGDYKTNTNALFKNSLFQGNQPLAFSGLTSTMIKHREYLTDIITNNPANIFKEDHYYINPGLRETFPWLNQIAANYESYRVHGMIFEFRSMSGNALNSVNTALGSVIMSAQYDSQNQPFSDKQTQEQYENTISFKSSENAFFGLECKASQNVLTELYINNGQLPSSVAPQFVNMAQFQISTTGFQGAGVNIGELWITYEIELFHPKLGSAYSVQATSVQFVENPLNSVFSTNYNVYSGNVNFITAGNWIQFTNLHPGSYYFLFLESLGTISNAIIVNSTLGTEAVPALDGVNQQAIVEPNIRSANMYTFKALQNVVSIQYSTPNSAVDNHTIMQLTQILPPIPVSEKQLISKAQIDAQVKREIKLYQQDFQEQINILREQFLFRKSDDDTRSNISRDCRIKNF